MGIKGKYPVASFSSCISSSKSKVVLDWRWRKELFHLWAISKHTKIDTLVDSGLQVNLISKQVVHKFGLETRPHPRPYPLGWISDNAHVHVTKHCNHIQFHWWGRVRHGSTWHLRDGFGKSILVWHEGHFLQGTK